MLEWEKKTIPKKSSLLLKPFIEEIINYPEFRDKTNPIYNAFNLAEVLGVSTCVYCNIQDGDTVTKKGKPIVRQPLDHFLEISNHPLFGLSLYNLIPSCTNCNSHLKSDTEFDMERYFHPYLKGYGDDVSFNYLDTNDNSLKVKWENVEIKLKLNPLISPNSRRRLYGSTGDPEKSGNVTLFEIESRYDIRKLKEKVARMRNRVKQNTPFYIDKMKNLITAVDADITDFYETNFDGKWYENEFQMDAYSKLKKDIFKQMMDSYGFILR
jgi:hypothetical protein